MSELDSFQEEVLTNDTRVRIFEYVLQNPGVTFSEINRGLGVSNGTIDYHIRILLKNKMIKEKKTGKFRRFYPFFATSDDEIYLTRMQEEIFECIQQNKDITQRDIHNRTNIPQPTISRNIKVLLEAKKVMFHFENGLKTFREFDPQEFVSDFKACPYCGRQLQLGKKPSFCPFCSQELE